MKQKLLFLLRSVIAALRMILWPPFCAYCRQILDLAEPLCECCLARIRPIVSLSLRITKKKEVTVFAVSNYETPLRRLIQAKHYSDRSASRQLGIIVWQQTSLRYIPFDCIVPIPLHWTRYARRGYNQAEEMAYELGRLSGKPVVSLLKRSHKTVFQAGLSRQERSINVREVFEVSGDWMSYKGKTILLVDDVMTTGATIFAAARALGSVRPGRVMAAVACRVMNN